MDFLDPKKQSRNNLYLMICYGLMSIGLVLATVILLSLAYGFGIGSNGQIVQSGRVYTGTSPTGASVYINDQLQGNKTNASFLLESGRYTVRYEKKGYHSWQHSVVIDGGVNVRYDYALLIPTDLQTDTVKTFDNQVVFASQSPNHRWLLVQPRANSNEFLRYDLKNPKNPPATLELSATLLTNPEKTRGWLEVGWADDNQHVLLARTYVPAKSTSNKLATEYILYDVSQPDASQNITKELNAGGKQVELLNAKYDSYYIFDKSAHVLYSATLDKPQLVEVLKDVAAYKPYGSDKLLYVTVPLRGADMTEVHEQDGNETYDFGKIRVSSTYLLNFTRHKGSWYVAFGSSSDGRISLYKDPITSLKQLPDQPLVPVQVLKVSDPKVLDFSSNTRFLMANSGQSFYVYDIDDDKGYQFTTDQNAGSAQSFAAWMDGYRITEVVDGRLTMFDYDRTNLVTMQVADASLPVFFSPDMKYVYSFARSSQLDVPSTAASTMLLQSTALRTPEDM